MSTTERLITAEELFLMPGDGRRELVKGELRMMAPAGFEHGVVTMRLARLLANHVEEHSLGIVVGAETGFQLGANPDTIRGADVAFVTAGRVRSSALPKGFFAGAPDLAVEVISPSDRVDDVEEKIADYLNAGARLVWVLQPRKKTVTIHRPDAKPDVLRPEEELDGADVVPGFRCRGMELFK